MNPLDYHIGSWFISANTLISKANDGLRRGENSFSPEQKKELLKYVNDASDALRNCCHIVLKVQGANE